MNVLSQRIALLCRPAPPVPVWQTRTDETTQKYYLIVWQEDMERTRVVNARILGQGLTDPLSTHSGSLGGQSERPKSQVLADQGLMERARRDSNPRPTD